MKPRELKRIRRRMIEHLGVGAPPSNRRTPVADAESIASVFGVSKDYVEKIIRYARRSVDDDGTRTRPRPEG